MGTVWALCGHCVGTVLPRLMRKLLLRVRASPALDGRQRQPGRRTRKKTEGPLNKRMRNDNLLHDTLSTCAAHNPTDGHVSDLPPMAASRATTKNKRTWPQSAGRPHIPSLHSGASEINARSPIACKVATSYNPPCNPQSQCCSVPGGPTAGVNIETGDRKGPTTKWWSGRLFRSHRTRGFGAEGHEEMKQKQNNNIKSRHA